MESTRRKSYKVSLSDEEYQYVMQSASNAGLPFSAYAREHHHLVVGQLAVLGHVSAEALQCERLLGVCLRVPLTVAVAT